MTEGRLEVESKSQECLVIIKREVTSNNLPKRRVLSSTHGVVGGRRLVTASYPIRSAFTVILHSHNPAPSSWQVVINVFGESEPFTTSFGRM